MEAETITLRLDTTPSFDEIRVVGDDWVLFVSIGETKGIVVKSDKITQANIKELKKRYTTFTVIGISNLNDLNFLPLHNVSDGNLVPLVSATIDLNIAERQDVKDKKYGIKTFLNKVTEDPIIKDL
jgi:hypothetical protein